MCLVWSPWGIRTARFRESRRRSPSARLGAGGQVKRAVAWVAVKSGGPGHYSWSACWSSVYFMGSSGLEGDVACQFDCDARNDGWRGLPGSLLTLRYDEVAGDVAARSPVQHVVELVSWDNA